MATQRTQPEPYDFLLAAGAIDRNDPRSKELQRASSALRELSRMNGTYKNLDPAFRADMREALACPNDTLVKHTCEAIARDCERLTALAEPERVVLRRRFSKLSHFWPQQPDAVLLCSE